MSKRTAIYRHLERTKQDDTTQAIIAKHKGATDSNGTVISRPIKAEKAARIASRLHTRK